MAVRLLLSSGGERTVDAADSARLDGPFFLVRRSYPDLNRTETVLTLLSDDVIAAEVLKDGLRIDYIAGRGPTKVGKDVSAMDAPPRFVPDRERSPGTLGAVLYAGPFKAFVSEAEWVALVRSVAEGDQRALHALYERAHRAVFTFVMRITANGESAEEVTLDVFHGVWRHASRYQEADGTVLGWIMNQAHSRAIDRRRFDHRQRREQSEAGDPFPATGTAHPDDLIAFKQQSQALGNSLVVLTPDERNAIEAAFFSELTYAEVAAQSNEPLGTIETGIHSGLHKLRGALAEGGPRVMTSTLHGNPCNQLEQVSAYVMQALAPDEVAAVKAHIASCPHCRQELETLRPVAESFVLWPTNVLRPSASLQERLAHRIAAETGESPVAPPRRRWQEPPWEEVAPGIFCKLMATDTERHRVSMLVRLLPGVDYPAHTHAGLEELFLLDGELWIDDRKLYQGDYNRAEAGSGDKRVWSETGCTCVLVTSTHDKLGS